MSKASKEKNKITTAKKDTKGRKAQKDKKTTLKGKSIDKEMKWDFAHSIAFWGLAVLLFLPPYFRGLFFSPEQERALIFAVVLFWFAWLWKWSKRDYNFLRHPMDYFALAFPVVYLISAFQAVNYGLAVDEVVKTTLYFIVYWLASRLVRNEIDILNILNVIYAGAIGVALAGLATATGIISINDGFLEMRIYSTFQYPNALASFLAAVIFLGFYLWHTGGLPKKESIMSKERLQGIPARFNLRYFYSIGNFLLLTVFIGTKSMGGFLVFSVMLVLFIIGVPKYYRIPAVMHFIYIGLSSLIAIWQFLNMVAAKNMGLAWLWIFAGLVLAVAGQALFSFGERKGLLRWITINKRILLGLVLIVFIAGFVGSGIYINSHSDNVKNLVEQLHLRNATERMYFFQDAMKMFKERPIIGWGGGGWQEAYRAFQGYLYNSNQVHGHYYQIMVETGIAGLLVILGIWVVFLNLGHRLYHQAKEKENKRFMVWSLSVAAISIGLHAVIDFDLSLSALALVQWTIFGLVRGMGMYSSSTAEEKTKSRRYLQPNYSVSAIVTVISILLVFFAGRLALAGGYNLQAQKYIQAKNLNQSVKLLQKASSYNPYNADYHSILARVYQAMGLYEEGIAEAEKAIQLSKYSSPCYADLAGMYLNSKKNSEDTINYAEKAVSLAPFQIQYYEILARTYFIVGFNELTSGNKTTAQAYLQKNILIPASIKDRMDGLPELEKRLWKDGPPLSSTPVIKLNVGASQYILGKWPEAESNLKSASQKEDSKGEALLWLSVLKSKQGKAQEAEELLLQAKKLVPQMAEGYDALKNLPILN